MTKYLRLNSFFHQIFVLKHCSVPNHIYLRVSLVKNTNVEENKQGTLKYIEG